MVALIDSQTDAAGAVNSQPKSSLWEFAISWLAKFTHDPRHYQISVLSSLILLGLFHFGFDLPLWHVCACLGSAVMTQFVADKVIGRQFDARSPLISALSLTLLLRTGSLSLSLAAGAIAIGSKYIIRWKGKHIFNPANLAIVVLALAFDTAWISPGQWGAVTWLAVLLLGLGGMVTRKASRWDVSLGFLISYAALLFGRAIWLGDPLAIPLHQMQSGAVLIFAFFMISDPKTTPNARLARLIYAAIVATIGFSIQFGMYNSAGVIFALVLTAPFVPLFDKLFPAARYYWPNQMKQQTGKPGKSLSLPTSSSLTPIAKGAPHAQIL